MNKPRNQEVFNRLESESPFGQHPFASPGNIAELAAEYHAIARSLDIVVPKDVNSGFAKNQVKLPAVAAFASNAIFAVELYIKAVYEMEKLIYPTNHDLWKLFSGLPSEIRKAIDIEFNLILGQYRPTELVTMHMIARLRKHENQAKDLLNVILESEGQRRATSIKKLLIDSEKSYQWWRYYFDKRLVKNAPRKVALHYRHLLVLCDVLNRRLLPSNTQR